MSPAHSHARPIRLAPSFRCLARHGGVDSHRSRLGGWARGHSLTGCQRGVVFAAKLSHPLKKR